MSGSELMGLDRIKSSVTMHKVVNLIKNKHSVSSKKMTISHSVYTMHLVQYSL